MLKFIKGNLESILGVEIYPVISFTIFFLFFIGMSYMTFRLSRKQIDKMKNIPLND